ncbi:MAG: RagB/SusD family nutrient uptake outer membrane protein [Gemmatimonadales bacterium]|nr:RagB/SusD family nutrient uptake outer membrane protein [Gemmatimonadales bacterium]
MTRFKSISRTLALAALGFGLGGCNEWLQVLNPTVIDVKSTDPVEDAPILAGSAQQSFNSSFGWLVMYSGWFTGESDVSETFPTRNEFGRRAVDPNNTSHRDDVWFPLHQGISQAYLVLGLTLPNAGSNIAYIRSHHTLGWSFLHLAEQFCSAVVVSGSELSTAQLLDSAVVHFTAANTQGTALNNAEGLSIARAALVGRARARLQAGQKPAALTDANAVPADFVFNIANFDDLAQRNRLGNRIWQFIADRGSNAVPPAYRVDDPRLPWRIAPSNLLPQDAAYATQRGIPYAIQNKYTGFASPFRLASKLEANYIAAEAQGTSAMLTLIQARRAANGQPAYSGDTGDAAVLAEFEDQRALEFYLEGKRLGDFRRNGAAVRNVPVPGATYWKPGFAPVGNQTCFPIPQTERDNNPNLGQV